ncbi:RDD family protein [Bacillus testis]|uniref:RDD family protein n=1 Tax=Bacillus testis TaxID=1622072 RepID=UPI000841196F|nr:RDD family protein [Bacillus testis]
MTERKDEITDGRQDEETNEENRIEQEPSFPVEERDADGSSKDHPEETAFAKEAAIENEGSFVQYAGFWMRFWAYLIDLLVIGSLVRILVKPTIRLMGGSVYDDSFFSPLAILSALVFFLYFLLMTRFFQQTLGKMVFGLRVVSLKNETLSWSSLFFREIIGRYICKKIWLLYVLVGILPKKQGIHDLFADTSVIVERRH